MVSAAYLEDIRRGVSKGNVEDVIMLNLILFSIFYIYLYLLFILYLGVIHLLFRIRVLFIIYFVFTISFIFIFYASYLHT